jgi:hypothetical protein
VPASWWDFTPSSAVEDIMDGRPIPGHAADAETSLMLHLRPELVKVEEALASSWSAEVSAGRSGVDGWLDAGIDKSTAEKGKALFDLTLEHLVAWLRDFAAGKTRVVAPGSDVEGYTIDYLGTRLWFFWAETCQEYMEQFRPRFIDQAGRPYPGVELDRRGEPIHEE